MSNNQSAKLLFLLVFIFAFCLSDHGVYAFGAGNIPSFAYMEGRAFRHGDIEDALAELAKKGAGAGFALTSILKGSKFNGLDIKRVYFGNWLRDYSQAVDVASLKKLQLQTIINLCMVLGFMAHGYATHEFEVTPERLGVYLPTEHIDNPKGYADGEDARRYHPKLRGPVDPRELEIDPRTGMKNYIANEQGTWDNSKNLVRRTVERCIHIGRNHRQSGLKQDEYEAYRLLGQSLHTLEDFPAHSNFCELALVSMGHTEVFVHVGDQARIQAPHGKRVAPLVTGTFGSSDFIHSLLGEATDHLSEASVSDLNKEIDKARTKSLQTERSGPGSGPADPADVLRGLLFTLPGGSDGEISRDLEAVQKIRAGPQQGGKRPEDMSPQELHSVLWQVLTFRDSVVKKISKTIEKIPGLGPLIEKIMDSISVFVFTTLEPFLKPLLKSATTGLQSVSGEVIDNHDQYEVFNDPRASDPTHSFLSKDHFNLILNEPAGQLARLIVVHTVNLVTKAWDDKNANVNHIVEEILQCLFHPDFHNSNSKIQREMLQYMQTWLRGLKNQKAVLQRLSKNAVRNHENIRLAGEGGAAASQGSYADNQAHQFQHTLQGYTQGIPGVSQVQNIFGGGAGFARDGTGPRSGPGAPGFPGQGSANTNPSPVSGQAASYYGGNARPSGPPGSAINTGQYPPPSGPPPPGNMGNYAPPSAPPSSFTSSPSTPGAVQPHHHAGYSPSYAPSYSSPPPAFPGSASPSFPGAPPQFPGGPALGGYAPPSGPPAFPGAPGGYAPPAGPPPFGFPDDRSPPQFPNMPGDASGFPKTFGGNDGRWQ